MEGIFDRVLMVNPSQVGYTPILQTSPPATEYYWQVRVMMVVVTFLLGLSMMNLFIAMLCLSYEVAAQQAKRKFMQCRAVIVLDQTAERTGIGRMFCNFCRRRKQHRGDSALKSTTEADLSDLLADEPWDAYVWFATQKESEH